jgi:hypothetical protein
MGRSDILRGLQEIKMRSFLTIVAVLGLLWAEPQPAFAQFYGPGPWCAVVNKGMGNMNWDCQYWSVQQCVPNVLAGNRGFCNPNPSFVPYNSTANYRKRDARSQ